jgi:calcium-dependent protein kinase
MGCYTGKPNIRRVTQKRQSGQHLSITPGTFVRLSHSFIYSYYMEIKKLGSGAFADVVLCYHKTTKTERAVKKIHKSGLSYQQTDPVYMLKEIQILSTIDHPYILKCFEIFEDTQRYYVATEYCPAGDLFGEIIKLKKFTESQAANIMFQLLSALVYCHGKNIIHRDLKPENIFLLEKGDSLSIKVADFGSSAILDPKFMLSGCFGSAYYLAPEVLLHKYNEKCDIWSVGIIMYILLTGKPPYSGKNSTAIMKQVRESPLTITSDLVPNLSSMAVELLKSLLIIDPDQRVSARDAIRHPWIQSYRQLQDPGVELALKNLKEFTFKSKLKEAVQIFLATQIMTHEEIKSIKKIFQSIDKNGDGKITKQELINEYSKNHSIEEAKLISDQIITKLDRDNDGNIDYTQFLVSCSEFKKITSRESLEIAFKMFDIDGSGLITVEEIKSVLGNAQLEELDDDEWAELVKEVDINGDGGIDLKEFMIMMTSLKNFDSLRVQ